MGEMFAGMIFVGWITGGEALSRGGKDVRDARCLVQVADGLFGGRGVYSGSTIVNSYIRSRATTDSCTLLQIGQGYHDGGLHDKAGES